MIDIKPTHKPITNFYAELAQYEHLGETHEGAVRLAFGTLLQHYARQDELTLVCEKSLRTPQNTTIFVDGMLIDNEFGLPRGYWEAKDLHDNLPAEIDKKFAVGYPTDNILFQTPKRAILYQNGEKVLDVDISDRDALVQVLHAFLNYEHTDIANWYRAVAEFKGKVPTLGKELAGLISNEAETNALFQEAFTEFYRQCQEAINPNLAKAAVEEMLVQHILTEQIFTSVFDNRDFTRRNIIAREIEKVVDALVSQKWNRAEFLKSLKPFYAAIERASTTFIDFSQKQHFINTVYEQFFQGFSVKVADTHGIVYTPQPIVDFIVKSVSHVLKTEFNRTLSDSGVNIIDPFVGTGNFIVRLMQELDRTALTAKYSEELHCNEVLLLPYYIASMNIEHEFYVATQQYRPYDKICLVDTFDVTDARQVTMFAPDNTRRVETQKQSPMFIIIGNPPYNAKQTDENDNNKNRKYPELDRQVKETYVQDSALTNKTGLYDPYVKAIFWALKRVGREGIVAFVTNNNFITGQSFDGMRKHLAQDFDTLYLFDMGGNIRKGQPGPSNVFGIQVGVSINIFVKTANARASRIFYNDETAAMPKDETFDFLKTREHVGNVKWQQLQPDARYTWITEGLRSEFASFIPMGTKEAKATKGNVSGVIFHQYSNGFKSGRDAWVINADKRVLAQNVQKTMDFYNAQMFQWQALADKARANVDAFVTIDQRQISWSRDLKAKLKRGRIAEYDEAKLRTTLYRPFTKSHLYFDRHLIDVIFLLPSFFPTPQTEAENQVICVSAIGSSQPFQALMADVIPNSALLQTAQCFPFYIYDEDGTNRRENVTDWALSAFRAHYGDARITKWDIFHYCYGVLHHPEYRGRYQADLKRDLPRLPFAPNFWEFVKTGERLAHLHLHYEELPVDGTLRLIETPGAPLDWRVSQMKFSKDKTQLRYNDFLTLDGIPGEVFDYRLGSRSALEWVVNQYRVKPDKGSGIVNDPNCVSDAESIVRLLRQVVRLSVETVGIVSGLGELWVAG